MSVKGLLIDFAETLATAVQSVFDRIGNDAAPVPGDETLQRQHKTIENLLATITGSYKSSEDIIPEEHTITRMYTAPTGMRSFTFDESGYLLLLKNTNDYQKLDLVNNAIISSGTISANGDTWTASDLISIKKCGSYYAVAVRNYAGTLNSIYVYSQALVFIRKFAITDPILGIAWNGTNLAILTSVVPAGGFGLQNTITYVDLEGTVVGTPKVDQRNISVVQAITYNRLPVKQELFYDDSTFFFPKILLNKTTGAIWGMTENGFLTRILKFTDMTGTLTQEVVITAIDYSADYLYMLMSIGTTSVIGVVKIND
jgi:hypothetical protein